ncbi:MAG TPA: plastocyanin/azurin family copper-binding protein [Nitrosopumilaceae archaeon]|nr:plastocyanin/azurin family copper-binding protein [Nitrosopumilaceae archaeon]
MSHSEHDAPILRTSPRRMGKMLAIIIGIQIVGGLIFFAHYDFWNSYLPIAGKLQEQGAITGKTNQGQATGKTVNIPLKFVESPDFKTYAFNALSGPDQNPEIHASVGDKIVFDVTNAGKSFHAFAITDSKEGPGPAIDGTTIGTADNPMKPGAKGEVTFVPAKTGEYFYICAVPGHRELGMVGKIEVTAASSGGDASGATVTPTGKKVEFSLSFVMSSDFKDYAFNALPGQPGHNPDIKVKSGDTVTIHIKNDSKSFHAFGVVTDPDSPNVLWNSALKSADNPMKPGELGDVTFVAGLPGKYHYICTVPGHAALGMAGSFIVE